MKKLIKNREIIEDTWSTVEDIDSPSELPKGNIIVSLAIWQQYAETLKNREDPLGILLASDEEPEVIKNDLDQFAVIAIHFPKFADGRGYTSARELRTYFNYQGEIRAVGDVLRDQLFQMERCGFNSFAVREDRSIEDALNAFNDFSLAYQADTKNPQPLFRR
ncbi:MAG: DUF934 domain-containing protein [Pseudomonadales bacterium]|nr:DUF934 domain-containing protein [Pseudomonadales bacterium]